MVTKVTGQACICAVYSETYNLYTHCTKNDNFAFLPALDQPVCLFIS